MLAENLAWIAALSKDEVPREEAGLRDLLNRMSRDVREVHGLLTQPRSNAAEWLDKLVKNQGAGERLLPAHGGIPQAAQLSDGGNRPYFSTPSPTAKSASSTPLHRRRRRPPRQIFY